MARMDRHIVIHYSELGLKRGNRDYFERKLCLGIDRTLAGCNAGKTRRISGRLLLPLTPASDVGEINRRLAAVFGIAYFAEAWVSSRNMEELQQDVWALARSRTFVSFRIDARRSDKTFPITSMDINKEVGAYVKSCSGASVNLEHPDLVCWIEVVNKYALIYFERVRGPGGLPATASGKAVVLMSGGIDSPVAAWKMIKRGCSVVFAHFHSFPYTNRESQEKAKRLALILATFQLQSKIYMVPFAEIQRQIMVNTPVGTRVILYRRYMLRLAEQIAERQRARVLVTGDSLGQVASQTLENIDVVTRAIRMPVLRPLIADDKEEIVRLARKIGTYEVSIQPDQDCCSLFVPRHPETRANLIRVEESERALDLEEAMKQALESAEVLLQYPAYESRLVRQL